METHKQLCSYNFLKLSSFFFHFTKLELIQRIACFAMIRNNHDIGDSQHPLFSSIKGPVRNTYYLVIICLLLLAYAIGEIYTALTNYSLCLLGDAVSVTFEVCLVRSCCLVFCDFFLTADPLSHYIQFIIILVLGYLKRDGTVINDGVRAFLTIHLPMILLLGLVCTMLYILLDAIFILQSDGRSFEEVNTTYLYVFSLQNISVHVFTFGACCRWGAKQGGGDIERRNNSDDEFHSVEDRSALLPSGANIRPLVGEGSSPRGGGFNSSGKEKDGATSCGSETFCGIPYSHDVLRSLVVLITAIVISTTSYESVIVDAIAAFVVIATVVPVVVISFRNACNKEHDYEPV